MSTGEAKDDPILAKKPRRHYKSQGGAWKVAYADLVTAMMAMFIVLWILNQDKAVIRAVGGYFKDPQEKAAGPGTDFSPNPAKEAPGEKADDRQLQEAEKQRLQEMARNLSQELARSPEFAGLMDQIKIEIIPEGLRIEIVESANDVFFEIGTSELKANTVHLLEKIGGHLKQLPNKIIVEGHTDSRPYTGNVGFLTNFELSADRANAARRALSKGGLPEKQIEEIRGCADSHLRDVKDSFNVVNRRISVIVKYGATDQTDERAIGMVPK